MATYEFKAEVRMGATVVYANPPELSGTIFKAPKNLVRDIIRDCNATAADAIRAMIPTGESFTIEVEFKIGGANTYHPKVVHAITGATDDGIRNYLETGITLMCERAITFL